MGQTGVGVPRLWRYSIANPGTGTLRFAWGDIAPSHVRLTTVEDGKEIPAAGESPDQRGRTCVCLASGEHISVPLDISAHPECSAQGHRVFKIRISVLGKRELACDGGCWVGTAESNAVIAQIRR